MKNTILLVLKHKNINEQTLQEITESALYFDAQIVLTMEKKYITDNKLLTDIVNSINQRNSAEEKVIRMAIFPNGTEEDAMVEEIISQIDGWVLLVRGGANFPVKEILDQMLIEAKYGADVVMLKRKKRLGIFAKGVNWCKEKIQAMNNFLLGFNFYEGDIGVQLFNKTAVQIMQETKITPLSKLNRWTKMNIKYIEAEFKPTKIHEKNTGTLFGLLALYFLFFAMSTSAICIMSALGGSFLGWLVGFTALVISIVLILFTLLRVYSMHMLGSMKTDSMHMIELS